MGDLTVAVSDSSGACLRGPMHINATVSLGGRGGRREGEGGGGGGREPMCDRQILLTKFSR